MKIYEARPKYPGSKHGDSIVVSKGGLVKAVFVPRFDTAEERGHALKAALTCADGLNADVTLNLHGDIAYDGPVVIPDGVNLIGKGATMTTVTTYEPEPLLKRWAKKFIEALRGNPPR